MDFNQILSSSKNYVPKRLSFDFLNNSLGLSAERSAKKRKLSDTEVDQTAHDTLNSSANSSICVSWETKLLKSDLIEAQTKITQLKKEIQHQNVIQSEMELKYNTKEKAIETERAHYERKATEFEKLFKKNRKNENVLKEENIKLKNQLSTAKVTFDQQLFDLQNKNETLKGNLSYKTHELTNQNSQLQMKATELSAQLTTTEEERDTYKTLSEKLKQQLDEFKELKAELDQSRIDSQEANMKVKQLEYEINSFGDWKDLSRASHSRLNNCSDMEKELERLRSASKSYQSSIGNKMLLEEQVHDLEARLKRAEHSNSLQIELKVKLDAAEKELAQWKQVGVDFIKTELANNPINLRSSIEKLLHRDLLLMSEKSNVSSEKSTIQTRVAEMENEIDSYKKANENLKKSLKSHQSVLGRLQKKLALITAERDSQRRLLENYEKDLTISQSTSTGISTVNINNTELQQSRIRIEMLEKTVQGYKELCAKLETENSELKGLGPNPDGVVNPDQYEELRRELTAARNDNEKLKKRKNELEIEIENFTLRHNVLGGEDKFKVLHFTNNPSTLAMDAAAADVAKLRAEVERLRIRNKKLESGHEDLTMRLNETMNMTINIRELQTVKEQLTTLQAKYKENEELFAAVNHELREVVYMLFGYKLDRFGNSNYRITSMFAESENDDLMFQLNEQGSLDMLETEFSQALEPLMDQYLRCPSGKLPAFTSALTLDLINRMTVTLTV